MTQPQDGEWYLATDGQWYCWPDPTPHSSRPPQSEPAPPPPPPPPPPPATPPMAMPPTGEPWAVTPAALAPTFPTQPLPGVSAYSAGPLVNASPPRKFLWLKIVLGVSVVIVLLVVGLITFVLKATEAPTKSARAFMAEVFAGDSQGAYALTAPELKAVATQAEFDRIVAAVKSPDGKVSFTSRSVQKNIGDETTAELFGSISGSRANRVELGLVKRGGVWLVYKVNFK